MLYFNPKPNFQLLSKYFTLQASPEVMEQQYSDGFPIVVDWYDTDEKVDEVDNRFVEIINKYGLQAHSHNLLYLCLGQIQYIEAIQYELYFQYAQKKRTKELASLLLAFESNKLNDYNGLLLKTFTDTAKVFDKKLIKSIGSIITNAVKEGKLSATDFEYSILTAFFDETENGKQLSIEKLKYEATKTVVSPKRKEKALYADFCLHLYYYMIEETNIKPLVDTQFSDKLCYFYFDLLVLFQYINADSIESDPQDYVRTLLKERIKKLNLSLSRK